MEHTTTDEGNLASLKVLRKLSELKKVELAVSRYALPENEVPIEDKKAAYHSLDCAVSVLNAFLEKHPAINPTK